ncbi:hypothetical protein ACFXC8_37990 [Streptomyces sp. NPDC059441]|uniref:hypothetical protein n=1 Tax=Streptomyces sp. NPDC059441 TaxID=3346829 RepID=UPI0036C9E38D
MRIVAIEGPHAVPVLLEATGPDLSWTPDNPLDRLIDTADARLAESDAAGIEPQVFSVALVWSVWA